MTELVNLEYDFTEKDYVSAIRSFNACVHHTKLWLYISAFVFFAGLVAVRYLGTDNVYASISLFIGFLFFLAIGARTLPHR
jgi:hypothetical protein